MNASVAIVEAAFASDAKLHVFSKRVCVYASTPGGFYMEEVSVVATYISTGSRTYAQ